MPKLTAAQKKEVATMQAIALCNTSHYQRIEMVTINHWEVDEVVIRFDGVIGSEKMYTLREPSPNDTDPEPYITIGHRRYGLGEFTRYNTPWLGSPPSIN